MSDAEHQAQSTSMTISKAVGIYAVLLIVFLLFWSVSKSTNWIPGIVIFVAYLCVGVTLNRVVLRGLIEWHPVYNTIENVSRGKIKALIFWPLSYPMLFFKLGVVKHL